VTGNDLRKNISQRTVVARTFDSDGFNELRHCDTELSKYFVKLLSYLYY